MHLQVFPFSKQMIRNCPLKKYRHRLFVSVYDFMETFPLCFVLIQIFSALLKAVGVNQVSSLRARCLVRGFREENNIQGACLVGLHV